MTTYERYVQILNFGETDRTLNWEFAYWGGALNRWYREGLPRKHSLAKEVEYGETVCGPGLHYPLVSVSGGENILIDRDVSSYFHFDDDLACPPVNHWIYPKFKREILSEDRDRIRIIDEDGITKVIKKDASSMPHWIDWPVKDRKTWEKTKEERFRLDFGERVDHTQGSFDKIIKDQQCPVNLFGDPVGFYGSIRFLVGEMNLLYLYYDDPALVKSILNFLTEFWINMAEEILSRYDILVCAFWEDMSGKTGPLIGPNIFKEFMSPCYKKLISFLRTKGVRHFIVDTDGNVSQLIPLFLEAGITGMLPFEKQADNDLIKIRKEYPALQMAGGFNKNVLARGRPEIDRELEETKYMIQLGGYIPYCDHLVPPNVPWDNYCYFRNELIRIIQSTRVTPA
jgi:hypothetical protein